MHMLAPTIAFLSFVHPSVRLAFERHDVRGTGSLQPQQLRRSLRELGVDVNTRSLHKLVDTYGISDANEGGKAVNVTGLSHIVEHTAVASPAKLWIALDPSGNGLRRTRRAWNRFAHAGIVTPARLVHYATGLASLTVGTADLFDCLVHAGVPTVALDDAVLHATVHTAAAVSSLPRFRYIWRRERPFDLWMPTARDANMWPAFIVFVWYTLAIASDFVRPPATALFASDDPAFAAFTCFTSAVLVYGSVRTSFETESPGMYVSQMANVMYVLWSMAIPILADTIKCLLVSHDAAVHAEYTRLVAAYPAYTQIYVGISLAALYLGNVACALSSAEHHGAVSKAQIADATNVLTGIVNLAAIFAVCRVDGGELALGMLRVTWDGVRTFVA